jgi:7-cyano-7-deazaguanine synthase
VLLSGGIDSTTVLAMLRKRGVRVVTVTFEYGQTLEREVAVAAGNAARFAVDQHYQVALDLTRFGGGCSLLDHGSPILKGRTWDEIAADPRPSSYVPFRNGIFFAYLVGLGEYLGIEEIYGGCNGLNSGNYPDDTKEFLAAMTEVARQGTGRGYRPTIGSPFTDLFKWEVVKCGLELGVDYSLTYSCYANRNPHCGECDSCLMRKSAMAMNGLTLEGFPG